MTNTILTPGFKWSVTIQRITFVILKLVPVYGEGQVMPLKEILTKHFHFN